MRPSLDQVVVGLSPARYCRAEFCSHYNFSFVVNSQDRLWQNYDVPFCHHSRHSVSSHLIDCSTRNKSEKRVTIRHSRPLSRSVLVIKSKDLSSQPTSACICIRPTQSRPYSRDRHGWIRLADREILVVFTTALTADALRSTSELIGILYFCTSGACLYCSYSALDIRFPFNSRKSATFTEV